MVSLWSVTAASRTELALVEAGIGIAGARAGFTAFADGVCRGIVPVSPKVNKNEGIIFSSLERKIHISGDDRFLVVMRGIGDLHAIDQITFPDIEKRHIQRAGKNGRAFGDQHEEKVLD